MSSREETLELLNWQALFAHVNHLLGLAKVSGKSDAFLASRDSMLSLQSRLAEAIAGHHVRKLRANGWKPSELISNEDLNKKAELYCFFERVLSVISDDALALLREATVLLQKMIEGQEMSQEEQKRGLQLFSAIESAFGRALRGQNKKEGGRR